VLALIGEEGKEKHQTSRRLRFNKNPIIGATVLSQFTSLFPFTVEKVQGKQKHFRAQDVHYLQAEFGHTKCNLNVSPGQKWLLEGG
jgi:hypothetical protein